MQGRGVRPQRGQLQVKGLLSSDVWVSKMRGNEGIFYCGVLDADGGSAVFGYGSGV